MTYIDYPYHIDTHGRSATTDFDGYVRDLIEQVLFTRQGERVNRPDFGCGLSQLVFAPNSEELATATQALVQGALQQWLGELIQVESVQVKSIDSKLHVLVQYVTIEDRQRKAQRFTQELSL